MHFGGHNSADYGSSESICVLKYQGIVRIKWNNMCKGLAQKLSSHSLLTFLLEEEVESCFLYIPSKCEPYTLLRLCLEYLLAFFIGFFFFSLHLWGQIGVLPGCFSSLLCLCVCSNSLQSRLTLCTSMDCSLPDSSVHGVLQARILECMAMPSFRGSSRPGDCTSISYVSCTGRRVLHH